MVCDIKVILPPYTSSRLEIYKNLGKREEKYGQFINFVPLDRLKVELPDVSKLNNISESKDINAEDLSYTHLTIAEIVEDKLNQSQSFPEKSKIIYCGPYYIYFMETTIHI